MDKLQYLDKHGHIQTDDIITWALATCHNVSQSDLGFVGNQVEVKMFATTGWSLMEASGQPRRVSHPVDAGQQLTIVRVNEFEHARRSMSVVALDENTGELHVFCKVGCFMPCTACDLLLINNLVHNWLGFSQVTLWLSSCPALHAAWSLQHALLAPVPCCRYQQTVPQTL